MTRQTGTPQMTRKTFVGGLGVAGIAALLAGCGSTSDNANGSSNTNSSTPAEGPTVQTASGPVKGTAVDGVNIWYAVPYGKSPEGELRWQAPQAPDSWTDARDCTKPGDPAIQFGNDKVTGTEDCLNLDVYAPDGAQKLPVLVYIHGGNNQTGNAQEIVGNDIVKNDGCVYVSLSYRLGLLGFNCLPALKAETGNFTMLDIAAALDWIRANIEAFGGDPNNVTVSGFSAGGRDVMVMMSSPYFAGKFERAIAFSGGMTTAEIEPSQQKEAAALAPLAVEDGKATDEQAAYQWLLGTGDDVREWLYGLAADRIAKLMPNAGIRMSAFPHLFEDDVIVPKGGFDNATYNNVPLIMLTGSTEFSFFSLGDAFWKGDDMSKLSDDDLRAAQDFAVKYGSDMYRIFNAECSAEQMDGHFDNSTWIVQVNYGDHDSPQAADLAPYGAFHGIFVPMLATDNQYNKQMNGAFDRDGYKAMAKVFNGYLKNFLAGGDPNGDGLDDWRAWKSSDKMSLVLDANETDALVEVKDVSSSYDQIIAAMDADTTVPDDTKRLVETNDMNGRWFSAALDAHTGAPDLWKVSFDK